MKCMCAQTRPRFILSSEGVLGEWSLNPCLLQGKNPLCRKVSPEEDRTRDAVDSKPMHYQLSYSGPRSVDDDHKQSPLEYQDQVSGMTTTIPTGVPTSGQWYDDHKQSPLEYQHQVSGMTTTIPTGVPTSIQWYDDHNPHWNTNIRSVV